MRHTPALILLLPLVAQHPQQVDLSFSPEPGSTLSKTFRETTSLHVTRVYDNKGRELGDYRPAFAARNERELVVTDHYVAAEGETSPRLRRRYDRVRSRTSGGFGDEAGPEALGRGPLEGKTVLFTFDRESQRQEVCFAEGVDGDPEWLDDLAEDLDLRFLLPLPDPDDAGAGATKLAKEDSWYVDARDCARILRPGGDLRIEIEEPGFADEVGPIFLWFPLCAAEALDGIEGVAHAVLEDVQGELATIRLEVELELERDIMERLQALAEELGIRVPFGVRACELALELQGEGTLVWNTRAGRLHSFELTAEVEAELRAKTRRDSFSDSAWRVELEGTSVFSVKTEVP